MAQNNQQNQQDVKRQSQAQGQPNQARGEQNSRQESQRANSDFGSSRQTDRAQNQKNQTK